MGLAGSGALGPGPARPAGLPWAGAPTLWDLHCTHPPPARWVQGHRAQCPRQVQDAPPSSPHPRPGARPPTCGSVKNFRNLCLWCQANMPATRKERVTTRMMTRTTSSWLPAAGGRCSLSGSWEGEKGWALLFSGSWASAPETLSVVVLMLLWKPSRYHVYCPACASWAPSITSCATAPWTRSCHPPSAGLPGTFLLTRGWFFPSALRQTGTWALRQTVTLDRGWEMVQDITAHAPLDTVTTPSVQVGSSQLSF